MHRYCISALNTALVTGDTGRSDQCFTGEDATCPIGSALRDLDLPTVQQEVATSLLIAGAWLGSMLASKPSDALGRRYNYWFPGINHVRGNSFVPVCVFRRYAINSA